MGKEAKIGLAVLAVLVVSLGGALGYRLWKNKALAATDEIATGKTEKRPMLSSGPTKPKMVTPAEGSRRSESEDRYSRRRNEWASSDKAIENEFEKKSPAVEAEPRANYMPDVVATPPAERFGEDRYKNEAAFVKEPAGPAVSISEAGTNQPADHDPFKHNPGHDHKEHAMPPAALEPPTAAPMTVNPVVYPQDTHNNHNSLRAAAAPTVPETHLHKGDHYESHLSGGPAPTNGHLNSVPLPNVQHNPNTPPPLAEHHPAGMNPLAPENLFHQRGSEHLHQPGETYRVQPNESYWVISQKVYGTGGYFKALAEHNRDRYPRPDQIQVGDQISVPSAATLAQAYPDLCPRPRQRAAGSDGIYRNASTQLAAGGRMYKVRQGDTLFDIARYELGKASRWAEIYELNRHHLGEDFDYLAPGTELVLPAQGASDPLTTRRTTPATR